MSSQLNEGAVQEKTNPQPAEVMDLVGFVIKLLDKESEGADGILVTFHIRKGDKIVHYCGNYENFKLGDWGECLIAMAVEARRARLAAATGVTKV